MHKLFAYDIDKSDGYKHLFTKDELDKSKLNELLQEYISSDTVLVYVNSQNVFECDKNELYKNIKPFIKNDRIRIASPDFNEKILTETTGVAIGSLTRRCS